MFSKHFRRALVFFFCIGPPLHARIIHVPGSYATIQAAINTAADGDTVLVDPGTYFENLNFRGKKIVVASRYLLTEDPSFAVSTVINGSRPLFADTASCVLFIAGEDSSTVLQGFTLTGGTGTRWPDSHIGGYYREGGGILTENSSPTIKNNRIVHNVAVNKQAVTSAGGGAIRCDGGNPRILNNLIAWNAGLYGGGIVLNFTGAIIRNNVIAWNTGGGEYGGSGIWAYSNGAGAKTIENNTIAYNTSSLDGGGIRVANTSMVLRNNVIWGNTAPDGPEIKIRANGSLNVTHCNVQGGWSGDGNVDKDPAFVDSSFYINGTSPCVDAGDSNAIYNDPAAPPNPGDAIWPSMGGVRNDMGAYGGPGRKIIGSFMTSTPREPHSVVPNSFFLSQNYPNPFNPTTDIGFSVPPLAERDLGPAESRGGQLSGVGFVTLKLYDLLGREVRTLVHEWLQPGTYKIHFDASDLASGVYFYRLSSGRLIETRRMVLAR